MKKALLAASIFCIVFFIVGVGVLFATWQWMNKGEDIPSSERILTIKRGDSLHSLGKRLQKDGMLRWPAVWVQFAKLQGLTKIKTGEYALEKRESPLSILKKINEGKVIFYEVTLVEGMNFRELVYRLQSHPKIKKTFQFSDYDLALKSAGINVDHPEGWFYPDTYNFIAQASDLSVLERAHKKMKRVISEQWEAREKNLPYKNAYEALIMASIVEKETGLASERGEIAGVFVRRLQKKMRLQTDPTVIYGMGLSYQGNITKKNLRTPTPYNTYIIRGLPPTPIAMPGVDAIYASLHPEPGESLYFVAKGDGSHYFSATLEEHNEAVAKYQKRRRDDYRSSPSAKQDDGQKSSASP